MLKFGESFQDCHLRAMVATGSACYSGLTNCATNCRSACSHLEKALKRNLRLASLVLAIATAATGAFANGSHAGGHDDETAAIGEPGSRPTRTVTVDMADTMRFSPENITAKKGETVRFVVKNSGKIKHEMVLGTTEMLKAHYAMMMKMPGMEHDEPNQVAVAPGGTGEIVWRFSKAGQVDFACLQPGHLDAGMKGAVTVR
jgi:uncharacterized cupredoxin-like copper-binding protein